MTTPALESPDDPEDLYLARGGDVPAWRPINTGDVFDGVPLTLGGERTSRAIVLTHPCTMRTDGVNLVDRLLVAPVEAADPSPPWRGHYRRMPLPELVPGTDHAANFDMVEPVPSAALDLWARVVVMQPVGVNLLLQRFVHHLSRVVVETDRFNVACAPGFAEVDLIEDWLEAALDAGADQEEAAVACHEWLRAVADDRVRSPQERLREPQQRAVVRRDAQAAVRAWIDRPRGRPGA